MRNLPPDYSTILSKTFICLSKIALIKSEHVDVIGVSQSWLVFFSSRVFVYILELLFLNEGSNKKNQLIETMYRYAIHYVGCERVITCSMVYLSLYKKKNWFPLTACYQSEIFVWNFPMEFPVLQSTSNASNTVYLITDLLICSSHHLNGAKTKQFKM